MGKSEGRVHKLYGQFNASMFQRSGVTHAQSLWIWRPAASRRSQMSLLYCKHCQIMCSAEASVPEWQKIYVMWTCLNMFVRL
eukprot:1396160-Amphidinium_carterae.1